MYKHGRRAVSKDLQYCFVIPGLSLQSHRDCVKNLLTLLYFYLDMM